jgi:hypothetical protein
MLSSRARTPGARAGRDRGRRACARRAPAAGTGTSEYGAGGKQRSTGPRAFNAAHATVTVGRGSVRCRWLAMLILWGSRCCSAARTIAGLNAILGRPGPEGAPRHDVHREPLMLTLALASAHAGFEGCSWRGRFSNATSEFCAA